MRNRRLRLLAGVASAAVAAAVVASPTVASATAGLSTTPADATQTTTAATYPITVDYSVPAGAEKHVGGGNLHPMDDRGPAQWLTDGININAVRGEDYSKGQAPYASDYLPGWFDAATRNRLLAMNPDAKLMIGTYYGFKTKVARGEYDNGNTSWQQVALDNDGAAYKDWIAGELADARAKGIDVYSWVLWNEPNRQWRDDQSGFFQAFKNAYDGIKAVDPAQRAQGPELAGFNFDYMTAFLTYCKEHNCVPDVLAWHELGNTRRDIEAHAQQLTQWMQQNEIPVMPMAVTEYQGSGYSTTDAGRLAEGDYNPGLSVSFLGELERASESTSLRFGLRSQWGLPGGSPNARGFLGEMATFDDKGKMATGIWYVYNAYWDMTGQKVGATFDKTQIDALATYDGDPKVNKSGILVGNWQSEADSVPVTLQNVPSSLVLGGRVHVQAELIGETLATANYGTTPVLSRDVAVTDGQASFTFTLPGRTAARIFITPPSGDPVLYTGFGAPHTRTSYVTTTGDVHASSATLGDSSYAVYTGGRPSSYQDANGAETAVESGDSVTYQVEVANAGIYNLQTDFVADSSGAFIQPYVDGTSTGTPVDLYAPEAKALRHDHGGVYLSAGRHEISYRIVGAGRNTESSGYDINIQDVAVAAPGVPSDEAAVTTNTNGVSDSDRMDALHVSSMNPEAR